MTPLWTHRLGAAAGGLALARETGHVLAWDARNWLSLLNRRGELQGQTRMSAGLVAGAIAEDGSALAVADDSHRVIWLSRDLAPRWRHRLPARPTALALDPLGRGLAVADVRSRLHLLDSAGLPYGPPQESARPLVQLHFVPAAPLLLAAADFGLVAALDPRGRRWVWQDAPVVHLGSLAASGDGQTIAVSCFSEGLRRYSADGQPLPALPTPEPCRLAALTYAGRHLLAGGVFGALHGLSADGGVLWEYRFDQPLIALALAPLGDWAVAALADGQVIGLDLGKAFAA